MGRCLSSSPRFFFSAGGIPYGGMALGTAYYAREAVNLAASGENASQALEMLHTVQSFQITYGAVMLSFLGAIHWGMEFAKLGGRQGHKRCVLVAPRAFLLARPPSPLPRPLRRRRKAQFQFTFLTPLPDTSPLSASPRLLLRQARARCRPARLRLADALPRQPGHGARRPVGWLPLLVGHRPLGRLARLEYVSPPFPFLP